ncbi:NAAT family transporter [Myxococcota bacterium]|nr:NAAT family transporter [Myxococcota bacterium]
MSTVALLKAFLGLFAMMNPIGNTGIFLGVTGDLPSGFKLRAAFKTCFAVLVILEIAIFGGMEILKLFGISIAAFQTAGGLIVLGIGMKMLGGDENSSQKTDGGSAAIATVSEREQEVSGKLIVPLAMPILGGPGSITTVVTVAAAFPTVEGKIGTAVGTAALVATMFLCFALSGLISRYLSDHAQEIILRFMGLILVAIGMDMMLGGIEASLAKSGLFHAS